MSFLRRRSGALASCAVVLLLLAAFVGFAALNFEEGRYVVARGGDGREVACLKLPESGRFGIFYRHSYYDAPAVEWFAADTTGFRLVEIASPSDGVLDYYGLEGEQGSSGNWVSLVPDERRRFESLPLIATEKGRRTLAADGEEQPLYGGDGPRHLTLEVEGRGCSVLPWR